MPEKSAAMRLPPVASTCLPNAVLPSTTAPTTTNAAVHSRRTGIGPRLPPPKTKLNVSFRIGCGADAVIHWATPTAMPSMPSVTRNDGMLSSVTRPPLITPTTTPTPSPASTPATRPNCATVMAATTDERPATEPTDRSISAAEITKVTATAITVIVAVWRKMLSRLLPDRNPESPRSTANSAKTTTNPM